MFCRLGGAKGQTFPSILPCLLFVSSGFRPDSVPERSADFFLFDTGGKLDGVCGHAADEPFGENPRPAERAEPAESELLFLECEPSFNLDAPVRPDLRSEGS